MRKIVVLGLFGVFGVVATACTTASLDNSGSTQSALEDVSEVAGDDVSEVAGDDDDCSDVDGDSGSGGPTDDGPSAVDGDSGSGGPAGDGSSSVDGDSGSGGNLNLAGITPKPKPKTCAPKFCTVTRSSVCEDQNPGPDDTLIATTITVSCSGCPSGTVPLGGKSSESCTCYNDGSVSCPSPRGGWADGGSVRCIKAR